MSHLELLDLRNIEKADLGLGPGLNLLVGRNAQGKTSVLEGVGLLSRGRSFRSEDARDAVRRGRAGLIARAAVSRAGRETGLEFQIDDRGRAFRVDGRDMAPREYQGRLEVVVYSTERLRVVRGSMRDRRQFLDRGAAALWPSYQKLHREFERVLAQRNAALASRSRDLPAWNERFALVGGALRYRRALYAQRLTAGLERGFRPEDEAYAVRLAVEPGDEAQAQVELRRAQDDGRAAELGAGRSLIGPHRDAVSLLLNGEEASRAASAGQARSLLLALALATLEIFRQERGEAAVALLDDLDSELDEERALLLCRQVAARGQALVTTAHPGWAQKLSAEAQIFHVEAGAVRAA
ncbi:MAG TPA: DNA replication and repair protein RecF [Vicinamibacteria bacterium]